VPHFVDGIATALGNECVRVRMRVRGAVAATNDANAGTVDTVTDDISAKGVSGVVADSDSNADADADADADTDFDYDDENVAVARAAVAQVQRAYNDAAVVKTISTSPPSTSPLTEMKSQPPLLPTLTLDASALEAALTAKPPCRFERHTYQYPTPNNSSPPPPSERSTLATTTTTTSTTVYETPPLLAPTAAAAAALAPAAATPAATANVVLDVAHNAVGVRRLLQMLRRQQAPRTVRVAVGVSAGKDARELLALLCHEPAVSDSECSLFGVVVCCCFCCCVAFSLFARCLFLYELLALLCREPVVSDSECGGAKHAQKSVHV
jgi:hypothetical protein